MNNFSNFVLDFFLLQTNEAYERISSQVKGNINEDHFMGHRRLTFSLMNSKQCSHFKSSTCELDPIPTYFIKECIKELAPVITRIPNLVLDAFLIHWRRLIFRQFLREMDLKNGSIPFHLLCTEIHSANSAQNLD